MKFNEIFVIENNPNVKVRKKPITHIFTWNNKNNVEFVLKDFLDKSHIAEDGKNGNTFS